MDCKADRLHRQLPCGKHPEPQRDAPMPILEILQQTYLSPTSGAGTRLAILETTLQEESQKLRETRIAFI